MGPERERGGDRRNTRAQTTPPLSHRLATHSALLFSQFLARHLAAATRPSGRGLSSLRPVTISLDTSAPAPGPAPASPAVTALVRAGDTAALAGVRLEVAPPPPAGCAEGVLVINVEIPPLCSGGGKAAVSARLAGLAGAVRAGLAGCADTAGLLIPGAPPPSSPSSPPSAVAALFVARLDIVLLSADGGEVGVALLAGAAALAAAAVPGVVVEGGRVSRAGPGQIPANGAAAAATAAPPGADPARLAGLLTMLPSAVSLGMAGPGGRTVLADPDAGEEAVAAGLVTAVVGVMGGGGGGDEAAAAAADPLPLLHAVFSGGPALAPPGLLLSAAAAARTRGLEARAALVAALKERGGRV